MTDNTRSTETEQPPASNTITVNPGGPISVNADLRITDAPPIASSLPFRASLCCCGHSGNKPYCDGSHRQQDVDKTVSLSDSGEPLEDTGGPLTMKPSENGPLRFTGNMTITVKGSDVRWTGTSTALCRCGLSGNKPFCDGSHRSANVEG